MVKRKRDRSWLNFHFHGELGSHIAEATRNASQPIRHHRVPQFYLRAWSDTSGRVRRTELDRSTSALVMPGNLSVGSNFYSIAGSSSAHPNTVEHLYSYLEASVAPVLRGLVPGHWIGDEGDIEALAGFLAAQTTRGMKFRHYLIERSNLKEFATLQPGESYTIGDNDSFDMPPVDRIGFALQRMQVELEGLRNRRMVAVATPPTLVSTDEPVVPLPEDLGARDKDISAAGVPILIFPVRPDLLLVSFHPAFSYRSIDISPLSHAETMDINRAILGYAWREAYELPRQKIVQSLRVPPLVRTTLEVFEGSLDGTRRLRVTEPSRWVTAPDAPKRVLKRWW